jgi:hypothetical protein
MRAILLVMLAALAGCSKPEAAPPAAPEPEVNSRTEFTDRIENYFEYEPFHAGKASQIRIHLTDLSDGSPVDHAQVTLAMHPAGSSGAALQTTSRIGKVAGIYVAEMTPPARGNYDIEFHIKNDRLDERLPLSNFKVE